MTTNNLVREEIKLSICIATFNRAKFIAETLDTLCPQLTDGVELVILDGGSTDATEQIVNDYAAKTPRLRYVRQETNNGVDKDFDRAVQLARGQYCWLMSDDDLIANDAVTLVLSRLHGRHSLYVVNAEVKSHDFSRVLQPRRLDMSEDRTYAPSQLDELFIDTGLYLTFIGCVVIERGLWLERQREPYFGSQFIHMGVIFQAPLPAGAMVIASVLITIRYGNASWKAREFEIWMCKWPGLVWSFTSLSNAAKAAVSPPGSLCKTKTLMLYRAKGAYSSREFAAWIRPRVAMIRSLVPGIVAVLPGRLLNAVARAYFSHGSRADAMTLTDLRNSRYFTKS